MSELLHLPAREWWAVFSELDGRVDPRLMIPLVQGEMQGLQFRRVRPGDTLERPTLPITWFVIIDDRFPGSSGPHSFDNGTSQWLFADAYRIAVDAAEPHMGLYEYFVEEGLKGMRILVVHTMESRLGVWREFSRQNCELCGIAEVVPVRNDPNRRLASITRFEGRAAPRM
jgi:hypothetical protein